MSYKYTMRAVIAEALDANRPIRQSVANSCYKDPVGILLGAADGVMEALDLRVLEYEEIVPQDYIMHRSPDAKEALHRMLATSMVRSAIDEFGLHATIVVANTKRRSDFKGGDDPDRVRCRAAMPFICRPGLLLNAPQWPK